jgi:hypothetical protein
MIIGKTARLSQIGLKRRAVVPLMRTTLDRTKYIRLTERRLRNYAQSMLISLATGTCRNPLENSAGINGKWHGPFLDRGSAFKAAAGLNLAGFYLGDTPATPHKFTGAVRASRCSRSLS